ncbi:MAG: hypothetical protein IPP73_16000 [Chitinophagaceae bacterium]|nr:hypothetical protein [Chitinophagaceae bacterium]
MLNPYSQPGFVVTEEYIRNCMDGAKLPHDDYVVLTGKQMEGDLYITKVVRQGFRSDEQALVTCMLRFLLLHLTDHAQLADSDAETIAALTNNVCINRNWYTGLDFTEIKPEEFKVESHYWFEDFNKYFTSNPPEVTGVYPKGYCGYFKNYQPVVNFGQTDPLSDEQILKVFNLVDHVDGKYYFLITEQHYMVVNWESGGPLHLLIKPDVRTPGTQMISQDAFYKMFPKKEGED